MKRIKTKEQRIKEIAWLHDCMDGCIKEMLNVELKRQNASSKRR